MATVFEPKTDKWKKLYSNFNENQKKVKSKQEAIEILERTYPIQNSSKISIKDVFSILEEKRKLCRYEIAEELVQRKSLKSYGGKWAHSLAPHLKILKKSRIIQIRREKFGQKKSFGSIIREVYVYNPKITEWALPDF